MTRPTTMLRWASFPTFGFPGRVEPNSGEKDSGFEDGEAPSAGEHNWLFGIGGDWVAYLDEERAAHEAALARAAYLDTANVFTAGPLTVDVSDATVPILRTTKTAANDAHGGNTWKYVGEFALVGTGAKVTLWSGVEAAASDLSTGGSLLFAVNAAWDPASAQWHRLGDDSEPMALVFTARGLRLSQQAALHAPWATWPTNMRLDADASGTLALRGEVTYLAPPTRHVTLNIHDFKPAVGTYAINLAGQVVATSAGDEMLVPMKLPHGAQVKIYAQVTQTGTSAPALVSVYARRKTDWPAVSAPSQLTRVSLGGDSTATSQMLITGSWTVDNVNEFVELSFVAGHAGDSLDDVWVEIVDPGPRNF
jgi:hypothetical protein